MKEIVKPELSTLPGYYQSYSKYLPEEDMLDALRRQTQETSLFLGTLSETHGDLIYSPGKWKLKEVLGHVMDTERILTYRALRFSRKDTTSLPGFDENEYAINSMFSGRTIKSIQEEWKAVRNATVELFSNLDGSMLDLAGKANNNTVSVRALLYFVIVHERHHLAVIRERYLRS